MIRTLSPFIGKEEIKAVSDTIAKNWLVSGPEVQAFEEEFADYVGAKYSVAVGACTHALHLCYNYIHAESGDTEMYIYTTPVTFTATANITRYSGYGIDDLEFIDINKDTLCANWMNGSNKSPSMFIPVDFSGYPNILHSSSPVINDMAHRVIRGCHREDFCCFSFHATKCMTTMQGGMITTNDEQAMKWFKKARIHGVNNDAHARETQLVPNHDVEFIGYKYNMTDPQAAMGRVQLGRLDWMNEYRLMLASEYESLLQGFPLDRPPHHPDRTWHLYIIQLKGDMAQHRDQIIIKMRKKGVQCAIHGKPLNLMTAYKHMNVSMPVAEAVFKRSITLPLHCNMKLADVKTVVDALAETIKEVK